MTAQLWGVGHIGVGCGGGRRGTVLPPCFWSQMGPTKAIRSFQLVYLPKTQTAVCFVWNSHVWDGIVIRDEKAKRNCDRLYYLVIQGGWIRTSWPLKSCPVLQSCGSVAVNKTKPLPLRSLKPSKELVISFLMVRSRLLDLKPIKTYSELYEISTGHS